ncbi:MAG: serine/threonine-protein kinase [Solirubrobacteraceae bacterium]
MPFTPGATVEGYRVDEQLGRGGMGVIYRATQITLDRTVALKVVAPELAGTEAFRERFKREARLAAQLDHPHVVPIYEAGETGGELFLAMRFVDGHDLATVIRTERRLDPTRAVRIIEQTASALDAAHARGLVHRDVKPANVLLEGRPTGEHAYLTDFGLVRAMDEEERRLTGTGTFMGSADYVPPEQILGGSTDARSDGYALTCVLYAALTGTPPFRRDNETATLTAQVREPPPNASEARPDLGTRFDALFRRGLAKVPEDRFGSAGELAAAARSALREHPAMPATSVGEDDETIIIRSAVPAPAPGTAPRAGTAPPAGAAVGHAAAPDDGALADPDDERTRVDLIPGRPPGAVQPVAPSPAPERGTDPTPVRPVRTVAPPAAPPRPVDGPPPDGSTGRRPRRLVPVIGLIVLIAAVVGGLYAGGVIGGGTTTTVVVVPALEPDGEYTGTTSAGQTLRFSIVDGEMRAGSARARFTCVDGTTGARRETDQDLRVDEGTRAPVDDQGRFEDRTAEPAQRGVFSGQISADGTARGTLVSEYDTDSSGAAVAGGSTLCSTGELQWEARR